jgi:hypothetical protein
MYYKQISFSIIVILINSFIFVTRDFAEVDKSNLGIHIGTGPYYSVGATLTDPQARRSGLPTVPGDILGMTEPLPGTLEEIPQSSVYYDSIDDHSSDERQPITLGITVMRPVEGLYTLVVTGTVLTHFDLDLFWDDRNSTPGNKHQYFLGVTDQGVASEFQVLYSASPDQPTAVVRVATITSAMKDLELAFKLDKIKNEGLKNNLLKKLQNAEAAHSRENTKAAENMLNAFLNEIKAQTGKGVDPDAAEMFEQEAQYILEHR